MNRKKINRITTMLTIGLTLSMVLSGCTASDYFWEFVNDSSQKSQITDTYNSDAEIETDSDIQKNTSETDGTDKNQEETDKNLPVPGKRTVKNLISTSLAPMGKCLYVYGGGWNVEDTGAGPEALQLGVADSWVNFFNENKGKFNYRYVIGSGNQVDDRNGTYPFEGRNNFYYDGMDCSAYIGWIVYNVMTTIAMHEATCDENGVGVDPGYVKQAVYMAQAFSADYEYGSFYKSLEEAGGSLLPGDIVSIPGHVYMCIGTCSDGSIVIAHSTPSADRNGEKGGGVQLTALDPNNNTECEALKLIRDYTKTNCPDWYEYYDVCLKPYNAYMDFNSNATTGIFRWSIGEKGLLDPDGYLNLTAQEILEDLTQ